MLMVAGQNEDISHGLQICKDQKEDSQRNENGYQFNNIGFIDDISIFPDTPEGMQKLLNGATKEVVRQKIIAACDLIKCHALTPELATELFISNGMRVFRFSAALI